MLKPGTLCIVVKAKFPENIGKIVTVTEFTGDKFFYNGRWINLAMNGDCWHVDQPLKWAVKLAGDPNIQNIYANAALEHTLQPLLDDDLNIEEVTEQELEEVE